MKMVPKSFLLVFLLFLGYIDAWRPYEFKFMYLGITNNSAIMCGSGEINNNSAGHTILNMQYEMTERIINGFMVGISMESMYKNMKPFRLNTTVNICSTFKIENLSPMVRGMYREITKNMDMPAKCPIEKGLYHVRDIGVLEEEFPPYIPFGQYKLKIMYFHFNKGKKIQLIHVILILRIIENKKLRPKIVGR